MADVPIAPALAAGGFSVARRPAPARDGASVGPPKTDADAVVRRPERTAVPVSGAVRPCRAAPPEEPARARTAGLEPQHVHGCSCGRRKPSRLPRRAADLCSQTETVSPTI